MPGAAIVEAEIEGVLHEYTSIEGVQEEGVLACAKHYPGHGDTALDSHAALPRVEAAIEVMMERELVPFRAAARAGGWLVQPAPCPFHSRRGRERTSRRRPPTRFV